MGITFLNLTTSSTWYLTGCFFTLYLFRPVVAITAILYLNLGDFSAALVGMSYGRTKITKKKSLEGFLGCFFTCVIIGIGIFRKSVEIPEYFVRLILKI